MYVVIIFLVKILYFFKLGKKPLSGQHCNLESIQLDLALVWQFEPC